jgi:YegS/Rv2252/BmrU family lipid kinase
MRIGLIARAGEDGALLDLLQEAVARWREEGHEVRPRATFEAGDARAFTRTLRRWADLLVVTGGDGTLNEVANGLVTKGPRPRLAIVPAGTANDFAAGIGLPVDDVEACLHLATSGPAVNVDIARVNGRAFLNVSVGGLGVNASRNASPESKRLLGGLAYALRGVREIADALPERGKFRADGKQVHDGEFLFFAVGNGRLTGGGTLIAPGADAGDGRMDLVLLRSVPKLELVRLLPAIRAGEHREHPEVLYVKARTVEVQLTGTVPVNIDGEPIEASRLRYRASGERVEIVVPGGGASVGQPDR